MAAEALDLIRDLAVVMVTAAATTMLVQRVRMPVVLGYLIAGLIVGPHFLPFSLITESSNVVVLAELGILFLLFGLGLDFHLSKLKKVGPVALTAGTLEVGIMIGMGILVANLFRWRPIDALFLGAILAISSTTIIVKVLEELGLKSSQAAQAIFGILLVEDLVAVILIALLSSIAITGELTGTALLALAGRIGVFVLLTLVIGLVAVPRLLDRIARRNVEETLIITALGVAFAMSLVALWLGLSVALGAFIAGAVVAESRASATIERRIVPLRDVFTAIFFVSTGILIDPSDIVRYWAPILILTAVSIIGKISAVSLATFVAGYPPKQAMRVGLGMAMVGEFSFIIAGLGRDLGVTGDFLFPIAVSVSALTTFITPNLIRHSDKILGFLGRIAPANARSYATMYTTWVGRKRGSGSVFNTTFDVRIVVRLGAYALLVAALGVTGSFLDDLAVGYFGDTFLIHGDVVALTWAFLALLALPAGYGFVQAIRAAVREIVYAVIPPALTERPQGAAAAAVMRRTLYVFLAVIAGATLFAAGGTFLPPLPLLIAAAILVGATAYALWGSLRRLNVQVGEAVDRIFISDATAATRDEVLSVIRQRSPWEVSIESVLIPAGSKAAHKRIRDIGLPQRTGAAIVTHERDGAHTVNPPPDLHLMPGDAVGLMGEPNQVEEARQLLTEEEIHEHSRVTGTRGPEVDVEEIEITSNSPVAGLTLAGSRIRERTGASVVGLRRDGMPILNPAPVTRLRPGDAVVVLGSPEQVNAARALLSPSG